MQDKSREIKFRAWIDSDRKMYRVLQLSDKFPDEGFYRAFINKERVEGQPMNYRITGKNALMQFTGMKDKNFKEIYEGDILHSATMRNGVRLLWRVVWNPPYYTIKSINSGRQGITPTTKYFWSKCEVIGNIFENPELLNDVQNVQVSDTTGDDSSNADG